LSFCWHVNLSKVAFATSLNHATKRSFFADIEWGTKTYGFKFYKGKTGEFFLRRLKPKFANFTGTKNTFTLILFIYPLI
jgi:hypothetical protein